ncbi:predicted protein [Nematostella vectensis]|uniref:Uncharacterized protein n=1 Tax=Nematostella vectensis TaxID=45351 RepID=A8DWJ5_NEMVE|nr:predicted protein [Nematostella vectensis]|eukprot:XP_001617514.1 hypothetical protein NEMVEDRAFT_v1g226018 [Nematostella vectensis]
MVGIYQFYEKTSQNAATQKGTLVETDATGWWYSSTLPNQKLVVGYMTDADIANQLKLKNKTAFNAQLQKAKHTSKRIQDQEAITAIQIVAAQSQYLNKTAGEAWLAVGDAGSSYDPIASMGIYKALVMSQFAAFAIADYLQGNPTGLAKYQHIINQDYQQYQTKKATYYNQEQRFSNSLFWQRRQKVQ